MSSKHANTVELIGTYGGDETHGTNKTCSMCLLHKPISQFFRDKKKKDGLRSNCKSCSNFQSARWLKNNLTKAKTTRRLYRDREDVKSRRCSISKEWNRKNIESVLVSHAKKRAMEYDIPFNLTKQDIHVPELCPALGIPLKVNDGKLGDGSPTIDRLVPELGYVIGNICVISAKANRIKNNSSFEEMRKIAAWMAEREQNAKHS